MRRRRLSDCGFEIERRKWDRQRSNAEGPTATAEGATFLTIRSQRMHRTSRQKTSDRSRVEATLTIRNMSGIPASFGSVIAFLLPGLVALGAIATWYEPATRL